ncbi:MULTISPECIES: hypothetical protein [unclassified Mesorhizobium]|nr:MULTISPECIES: hypothetical protein [unclassified Mesorhizobium]
MVDQIRLLAADRAATQAGGISSNVHDPAKWMIVLLADGTYNGHP